MRSVHVLRLMALCSLLILVTPAAHAASGGDLGFGYTWRDRPGGATYQVLVFSPTNDTFMDIQIPDNSAPVGPIPLGFAGAGFPFYGTSYNQIWISDNGWISFTDPLGNSHPTPSPIYDPAGPSAMLAPRWDDLQVDQAGQFIRHGRVNASDAYKIQFNGALASTGEAVVWEILLFADGRIKFQYSLAQSIGLATIGIENAAGNDGIQIAAGGVIFPTVAIIASSAIEFRPPSILAANCASVPSITCGITNGTSPAAGPNVRTYGCGSGNYGAQEAVYNLTLAQPSRVTVSLTAATALAVFLVQQCNEYDCIRGPSTNFTVNLTSGTYTLVVDGLTPADQGAFTLDVACVPLGPAIACGGSASGTTVGGPMQFPLYGCSGGRSLSGPEAFYELTVAATTNVRVTLSGNIVDLDVLILRPTVGEILANSCVAWGDTEAIAWNATPGTYIIVVDGVARAAGDYTIDVACRIDMDCSTIAGTADLTSGAVQTIRGDNSFMTSNVGAYNCAPGVSHPGGEQVWTLVVPTDGLVAIQSTTSPSNHTFYILSGCNEGACITAGGADCAAQMSAGTYYIVVDSIDAGGPYEAMVVFDQWYNPWRACENPVAPTTLSTRSSDEWHFDDGAFCIEDPNSINHPDGCVFAMYLTANCGTSLHIPLFDVEGGHLKVFDVFRGEYVWLTANSPRWSMSGYEIQWQDPDCVNGSDPRWNNVVTDISFDRPEGLCGVFRLEFINHSGFVWDLYSNCTGAGAPGFQIHDSLCRALADYSPLPNISIVSATATYNCPEISVTYTVRNDGCATVYDFPVEVLDGGNIVGTDLVPVIAPGEVTRTYTVTFPITPTNGVSLAVDSLFTTLECIDAPDSGCNIQSGLEVIALADCSGQCEVVARAVASASAICEGDTVTVDATTSFSSLCPGGLLEYQLSWPGGLRPWQPSPIFSGLIPTDFTSYVVDARCADPALQTTCFDLTSVNVEVDKRPAFNAAGVMARDAAPCNQGIQVTWEPATWRGSLGTGTYAVYKSTVSCADALTRLPVAWRLTDLFYWDPITTEGVSYYYVVEAEDNDPDSACLPQGPTVRGATTRVEANGGTCVAVTDATTPRTDILPRVGASLRLGGTDAFGAPRYSETFVDLEWNPSRPADPLAGEHFHVLRSSLPNSGFAAITTDAPPLSGNMFTDAAADQPNNATYVFFYLVYSADACENENRAWDDR